MSIHTILNYTNKASLHHLDSVIQNIPDFSVKSCASCGNLRTTIISMGLWWSERRCHYCDNYSEWSDVRNLKLFLEEIYNK